MNRYKFRSRVRKIIFSEVVLVWLAIFVTFGGCIAFVKWVDSPPPPAPVHSVTGVVTNKGFSVKPIFYWIDVNGREFNPNQNTYESVQVGEKVRVVYQDDSILSIEKLP